MEGPRKSFSMSKIKTENITHANSQVYINHAVETFEIVSLVFQHSIYFLVNFVRIFCERCFYEEIVTHCRLYQRCNSLTPYAKRK